MFHDAEVNGHARHTIGCAVILAFAAVLMQCAHGQPGTGEQPPLLPQTLGAETRVFRNCPGCPEMVEIPGGTFPMGTNGWRDDTRPAHTVTVGPFAMGLRESHPGRVRRLCRSNRTDPAQLPVPPVRQRRRPVPDLARRQGLRRLAQPPYGSALEGHYHQRCSGLPYLLHLSLRTSPPMACPHGCRPSRTLRRSMPGNRLQQSPEVLVVGQMRGVQCDKGGVDTVNGLHLRRKARAG